MKKILNFILIFSLVLLPVNTYCMVLGDDDDFVQETVEENTGEENIEIHENVASEDDVDVNHGVGLQGLFSGLKNRVSSWWSPEEETELTSEEQQYDMDNDDNVLAGLFDQGLPEEPIPVDQEDNHEPEIIIDEEDVVVPAVVQPVRRVQPQPALQPSLWQQFKNRGKSCGRWIKQNPVSSLMMLGGSAALGLLAASRNVRKASKKLIVNSSKIAASYTPKAKSVLRNRYFWYGTGLLSGGVATYIYRKQISEAPGRWTRDAINAAVDAATDRMVHNLENPDVQARVDQALRARGQNLGGGITEGAVARLEDDDVKNNMINAGGDIAGRAGQQIRENRWIQRAQYAGYAMAALQLALRAQTLFTWAGGSA